MAGAVTFCQMLVPENPVPSTFDRAGDALGRQVTRPSPVNCSWPAFSASQMSRPPVHGFGIVGIATSVIVSVTAGVSV